MEHNELKNLLALGENSSVDFKEFPLRAESLAREMVSFANSSGGIICIGIADNGTITGINEQNKIEEWVMNIAHNSVTPSLTVDCEIITLKNKSVCIVTVPKGSDKPYQSGDKYLIRVGSTNRVATQSELMRLFQLSGVFHYDTVPVSGAKVLDLNTSALDDYFANYGFAFSG